MGKVGENLKNERVLVIGSGYSAVTALDLLSREPSPPSLLWVTRHVTDPYETIPNDSLPQRAQLVRFGNEVSHGKLGIEYLGDIQRILQITENSDGTLEVLGEDSQGKSHKIPKLDHILALVGYSPDMGLTRELHIHYCWASEGPMKLAASLVGSSGDCLSQVSAGPQLLISPEPDFYILGSKSYGRNSRFLLKIGLDQIRQVLSLIKE